MPLRVSMRVRVDFTEYEFLMLLNCYGWFREFAIATCILLMNLILGKYLDMSGTICDHLDLLNVTGPWDLFELDPNMWKSNGI